jgi:6-pyruvoyltetrahydropterin/6-carboxytetrahydropterin synthase
LYQVSVQRTFIAQHYLTGGDWGKENQVHSHPYRLELILSGHKLDQHYYLVDIVMIEKYLDEIIERYQDRVLNDLPEFSEKNPSIELFAEILCKGFHQKIQAENILKIRVVLWENKNAWAAFEQER